jgi:hypothetical protein
MVHRPSSSMPERPTNNPKSESNRWLVFFESGFVLGPVGIIGGLAGVFFYTPVCLICVVCVLLGLHRSGAVAAKSRSKQLFYYVLVGVVTTALLIAAGIAIQSKAGQYTRDLAHQIAGYIKPQLVTTEPADRSPEPSHAIPAPALQPSMPQIETYLSFDGPIRIPQNRMVGAPLGAMTPERAFVVGDKLAFNYFLKVHGPNPIQLFAESQSVYLESDANDDTQRRMIDDFKRRTRQEWKKNPQVTQNYVTLRESDSESHFNTAFSFTSNKQYHVLTLKELDDLNTPTAPNSPNLTAFVVIDVPYKESGKWHHLRTCRYPVPPLGPPVIWHFCNYFTNPD